ncbi:hypothetical protein DFS33DRAFT_1382928 [Desarmillaria ectypa]|nr:hypothetical protein DFS33DRAFT_1382928 [Desarmillaria ectypa]
MEKHSYDVEVAPEIRQLKQSEKNAKELEKSNRILTEGIEKLKLENSRLTYEIAGIQDSKTAVKVEQVEIIPKREEVEKNVEMAEAQGYHMAQLTSQYEDVKKNTRKKRQSDVKLANEGAALTRRIGELEDVLEKLKKNFKSRKAIPLHTNERRMLMDAVEQCPLKDLKFKWAQLQNIALLLLPSMFFRTLESQATNVSSRIQA